MLLSIVGVGVYICDYFCVLMLDGHRGASGDDVRNEVDGAMIRMLREGTEYFYLVFCSNERVVYRDSLV